ncbi:MAG: hypothetical protein UU81_C0017G0002 [Microgenomates group bacterium GW2011_GWC1_41_8]|uniref:Uncharacterized protein n=2 Tax=Candidatus Roizmaniibacteriota TaxID=1752723 RepID=A0A0G0T316_9BACT|nr:MAG: hypothetical protein UU14_C0029G0008 [Candidatus Roizmanbacteria bacterium GW2011_GWB1_40_7]KKR92174.1 MAG: hypothetical protein UU41_C0028G0007 [Candidatus Roizmanbacteria bacterium GW2011_GWA1_41_13]KKS23830.1 MAG: hypothetical protein UU81_C0017G0002 [Microgenomates group bacterium GW2011_GWC1_41_8]OGK50702.1 MAG: hypothetical protein A3A55_01895 [Candidatus Roizmanbacteria bacterium RIFCSPLOWO2_01_FULL_40_14]
MATSEIPFPEEFQRDVDVQTAVGLMSTSGVSFDQAMDMLGYRTITTAQREVYDAQGREINPFDQDTSHTI